MARSDSTTSAKRSLGCFLILSAALVLAGAIRVEDDQATLFGVEGTPCRVQQWLGVRCPGCGLTRAAACVVHGRFREAYDYHPGAFAVVLLATGGALAHGTFALRGRVAAGWPRIARAGRWFFVLTLLAVSIQRLLTSGA